MMTFTFWVTAPGALTSKLYCPGAPKLHAVVQAIRSSSTRMPVSCPPTLPEYPAASQGVTGLPFSVTLRMETVGMAVPVVLKTAESILIIPTMDPAAQVEGNHLLHPARRSGTNSRRGVEFTASPYRLSSGRVNEVDTPLGQGEES